ncbi:MAG: isocitrate/isopropylmalate family dehydrogenase, partial [Candidatus Zipacnadales bacterium]
MAYHRIAVIPGDGIGIEVITEGLKCLRVLQQAIPSLTLEFTEFPWGCGYYLEHGKMIPEHGIEILRGFDASYLGGVG